MNEFLHQTTQEFQIFLLILVRVSCLIVVALGFRQSGFACSAESWSFINTHMGVMVCSRLEILHHYQRGAEQWFWALITEAVFGLAIAFVANLYFYRCTAWRCNHGVADWFWVYQYS